MHTAENCIIELNKIPHFRGKIATRKKYHITIGNETVMGNITLFSSPLEESKYSSDIPTEIFRPEIEYAYEDEYQ